MPSLFCSCPHIFPAYHAPEAVREGTRRIFDNLPPRQPVHQQVHGAKWETMGIIGYNRTLPCASEIHRNSIYFTRYKTMPKAMVYLGHYSINIKKRSTSRRRLNASLIVIWLPIAPVLWGLWHIKYGAIAAYKYFFSVSTLSSLSQGKSKSLRPKCPYAAVCL